MNNNPSVNNQYVIFYLVYVGIYPSQCLQEVRNAVENTDAGVDSKNVTYCPEKTISLLPGYTS